MNNFDVFRGEFYVPDFQKLIQVLDTLFPSVTEVDDVDQTVHKETFGLGWLGNCEQLLDKYENSSKTEFLSHLVVHD